MCIEQIRELDQLVLKDITIEKRVELLPYIAGSLVFTLGKSGKEEHLLEGSELTDMTCHTQDYI